MKCKTSQILLLVFSLVSCTRENSSTGEMRIAPQISPTSEPVIAVTQQTQSAVEPASGVTEQMLPSATERACSSATQYSANNNSMKKWIHGSWVKVQATPSADGAELTHLTTNTPVEMISSMPNGDHCEISWGNGQHGFVPCGLLGNRPLTIEDLGQSFILVDSKTNSETTAQLWAGTYSKYPGRATPNLAHTNPSLSVAPPIKKPNPNYLATCAFWIEPNLGHLREAGLYFEDAMLTAEQKDIEDDDYLHRDFTFEEAPPLPRFQIPEFEAMKDLMRKGLIAPSTSSHPSLHKPATVLRSERWDELRNTFISNLMQIKLPPAKTSYFKSLSDIGRPSAGTEELSYHFQIPYSINVVSGPSWERDEENFIFKFGAWDMGGVQASLIVPLQKNTITNHGVVSTQATTAPSKFGFRDSTADVCVAGFQFGGASIETAPPALDTTGQLNSNGKEKGGVRKRKVSKADLSNQKIESEDTPLFYFYTKKPLAEARASVNRGKVTKLSDEYFPYEYASIKYFDINNDNMFDFAVWEGMRPPTSKDGLIDVQDDARPEPNLRMIFVNVGGEWYLIDADHFTYSCGDSC